MTSPGNLHLSDVNCRDNIADGNGGGVYFAPSGGQGIASFLRCTFSGNQAGVSGGGIFFGRQYLHIYSQYKHHLWKLCVRRRWWYLPQW